MFGILKEIVDRFIEFVLRFTKGDSIEEKLTSALKSIVFLCTVFAFGCISLIMTNINLRVEIDDMEAGIARMNQLFDPTDGGPIKAFVRINDSLTRSINLIKDENIVLLKNNIHLSDENNFLRPYLYTALENNERISRNNDLLATLCIPDPIKPSQGIDKK